MLNWIGLIIGFIGGFALGLLVLGYITRGMKKRELLADGEHRVWLGLLGWFFAGLGGWLGWLLGDYLSYAYR
jgi:hypothetical protein